MKPYDPDGDGDWRASSKEELLVKIAEAGKRCNPYALVGGIVREVAVDRWCNELERDALIFYVGDDRALITPLGLAKAKQLRQEWDDVQDSDSL